MLYRQQVFLSFLWRVGNEVDSIFLWVFETHERFPLKFGPLWAPIHLGADDPMSYIVSYTQYISFALSFFRNHFFLFFNYHCIYCFNLQSSFNFYFLSNFHCLISGCHDSFKYGCRVACEIKHKRIVKRIQIKIDIKLKHVLLLNRFSFSFKKATRWDT